MFLKWSLKPGRGRRSGRYTEKSNVFSSGYNGYIGFYYILAELLPENVIREYQFNTEKIDLIFDAIEQIDSKKDHIRALNIVMEIMELKQYNSETEQWTYKSDVENLYNLLNSLYEDVKGKKITEDMQLFDCYLLDDSIFVNKKGIIYDDLIKYNEFKNNLSNHEYLISIPKTYLTNSNINGLLVYVDREANKIEFIEITENIENEYFEYKNELKK